MVSADAGAGRTDGQAYPDTSQYGVQRVELELRTCRKLGTDRQGRESSIRDGFLASGVRRGAYSGGEKPVDLPGTATRIVLPKRGAWRTLGR